MKLLLAAGLLWCACRCGWAQYFHQPQVAYEPMTFDLLHRGTFNMSYCSRELLNCWEIIKADHMCGTSLNLNTYYGWETEDWRPKEGIWFFWLLPRDDLMRWSVYESVCGIKREYCDDVQADQDLYPFEFGLFEHYCPVPKGVKESLGQVRRSWAHGAHRAGARRLGELSRRGALRGRSDHNDGSSIKGGISV